jgi:predicted nucleic acid-binding protein
MVLLDTTFLIELLRENEDALRKLTEYETNEIIISTTVINILELYRGAYISDRTNENLCKAKKLLTGFQILNLDEPVYEIFALLSAELHLKGQSIKSFDELIAAIALYNNEPILTKDNHFKKVQNLEVITY